MPALSRKSLHSRFNAYMCREFFGPDLSNEKNLCNYFWNTVANGLFFTAFIPLIIAAFVKKEENPVNNAV